MRFFYVFVCFLRTFIYFLLSTIVHVAYIFSNVCCPFNFADSHLSGFFFLSLCVCNACYAKAVHIKRGQVRFSCPENGKNRYSIYSANFCRFKIQMDLEIEKSKMHECSFSVRTLLFWNVLKQFHKQSREDTNKKQTNCEQTTSALLLRLYT